MYGLYGLKHHIEEISGDVTEAGQTNKQTRTRQNWDPQLLICESLSLANCRCNLCFYISF